MRRRESREDEKKKRERRREKGRGLTDKHQKRPHVGPMD